MPGLEPTPARYRHDLALLTVWRVQLPRVRHAVLPPNTSRPNPLAVGGRLFVSVFAPGAVVCLDRHSGEILWRRRLVPFGGEAALHANGLLYAKSPHTLYCLEPETGRLVWKFCPHGTEHETMYSPPAVKDGRLFIGDRAGYLYALDASSGRPLWRLLTSRARNNDVNGLPLLDGDRLVLATNAGRAFSIDPATGSIVWTHRIGQPSIREIAVSPNGYLVATSNYLSWLEPRTGKLLERRTFPRRRDLRTCCSRGRHVVLSLSDRNTLSEIVGLRDNKLLFTRRAEWLANLRWLPSGLLVETRFEGIGVLNPRTGDRLHDIHFDEDCQAAQPDEVGRRLYLLTARGVVLALRWPPTAHGRPSGSTSSSNAASSRRRAPRTA